MLPASSPLAPGFWRNETSGILAPAVMRYLEGRAVSRREVRVLRQYLIQWIEAPVWMPGAEIETLRRLAHLIESKADVDKWTERALNLAIDPW